MSAVGGGRVICRRNLQTHQLHLGKFTWVLPSVSGWRLGRFLCGVGGLCCVCVFVFLCRYFVYIAIGLFKGR